MSTEAIVEIPLSEAATKQQVHEDIGNKLRSLSTCYSDLLSMQINESIMIICNCKCKPSVKPIINPNPMSSH
jgi:hypothetical protein